MDPLKIKIPLFTERDGYNDGLLGSSKRSSETMYENAYIKGAAERFHREEEKKRFEEIQFKMREEQDKMFERLSTNIYNNELERLNRTLLPKPWRK